MATFIIIALVGSLSIFVSQEAIPMDVDFEQFQWKNRLLFVFAPESTNPLFERLQREISTRKHEVDDRDLVIFEILELGISKMNGTQLDPHTAPSLRKRFDISPKTFTLILVGKDGGVKLKRNDHVKLEEIFRLIDSMPMRQDEMRQKGQSF
ncbi:MAG: DUF4174 domain-containing protein [Syntrophobacteraceae bacterium]|nr:DUF4174 domain-containing protein [Syntrophobacteraceae bacterium]